MGPSLSPGSVLVARPRAIVPVRHRDVSRPKEWALTALWLHPTGTLELRGSRGWGAQGGGWQRKCAGTMGLVCETHGLRKEHVQGLHLLSLLRSPVAKHQSLKSPQLLGEHAQPYSLNVV